MTVGTFIALRKRCCWAGLPGGSDPNPTVGGRATGKLKKWHGGSPGHPKKETHKCRAWEVRAMRALTKWDRWDPFKELEEFENRLMRLFSRLPAPRLTSEEESVTVASWVPLVDVIEDEKEYLLKVELPEIKKDDVKVTVENGVLTISGERKVEKEEKGRTFHRIERAYGRFERSFTLPDDIDADKVNAEFKDGVLYIHLPKSEKAKPRAIEVKVA